jgi:hypothetical protein
MKNDVVGRAAVTLALLAAPALVAAQGAQAAATGEPPQDLKYEVAVAGPGGEGPLDRIVMVHAEESFEARVVKGAPYQAEAVTEFVQPLADGNRIVRRSSSTVARDGEGRTRREHGLAAIGPMIAGGPELRSIFINDPVAGVSWVLEPGEKVARKLVRPTSGAGPEGVKIERDGPHSERIVIRRPGGGGPGAPGTFTKALPKPETEDLGTKVIDGIEAKGTRSTTTIPAGEMGNEKPLVVVTERWYSPELSTVVMSKHSDPRMGETTFRLTQISRGEPERALFEVPSDYTVKEGGPGHVVKIERQIQQPKQ